MGPFNETTLNTWLATLTQPSKKAILEQLNSDWKACLKANFSFTDEQNKLLTAIPETESIKIKSAVTNAIHSVNEGKHVILKTMATIAPVTEEFKKANKKTPDTIRFSVVQKPASKEDNHPDMLPIVPIIIIIIIGGDIGGCWNVPIIISK